MGIIPENVIEWLLEESNPSIRYRTMIELQDLPSTSNRVEEAQEAIEKYPVVQNILKKMQVLEFPITKSA